MDSYSTLNRSPDLSDIIWDLCLKIGLQVLGAKGLGSKELGVEVWKSKAVIYSGISFVYTPRFGYQFEIINLIGNFSTKSVRGKPVSYLYRINSRVLSELKESQKFCHSLHPAFFGLYSSTQGF